jgi:hypothetical protein
MSADPLHLAAEKPPFAFVETEFERRGAGVDHADRRLHSCNAYRETSPSAEYIIAALDIERISCGSHEDL